MKKNFNCYDKKFVDLHIHSSASDGTLTPSQILLKALSIGLKAISITDHDTMEGSRIALGFGIPSGIKFISGVEVSVFLPSDFNILGSVHILGYGVKVDDKKLSMCLRELRVARKHRVVKIIKRLSKLGIVLSEREIMIEVGKGGVIGRPHIASIMVKKGFVNSISDAFEYYLGYGKPAYIQKKKANVADILTYIRKAGGISVLAHPHLIGIKGKDNVKDFIIKLKSMGLMGIEAIYPEHSESMIDFYSELASTLGLLISGGTDFHGKRLPGVELGFAAGDFCVPHFCYENIFNMLAKI